MLHKRFAVAAAVSVAALLPTMGSAQVVASINTLIADVTEEATTKISAIAGNDADIDGSVNIDVIGEAGSTNTSDISTTVNDVLNVAGDGSLNNGSLTIPGLLIDVSAVGGSGGLAVNYLEDNGTIDTSSTTESVLATTVNVGDVSATALGAVNTGTVDLTEVAGTISSASSASSSSTDSAAEYALAAGSGLSVEHIAANTALINGSANINFAGNGSVGLVTTTAAGAINSSDVTASITGAIFGNAPVQP